MISATIWKFPNLIKFDQVWSIFDRSDPKKIKNKMTIFILFVNVATIYTNIFWYLQPSESFQFDQVWSSLIHFGQIWSKKIKNKMTIFILFVNVTTFYSIILWSNRHWGKMTDKNNMTKVKKLKQDCLSLKIFRLIRALPIVFFSSSIIQEVC